MLDCRACVEVRWLFSSNLFGNKYTLLFEFHSKVEGIGNPEELRERFEVSDPPVEQPQRAGILGLKKDLNITRM